jgi:4-amino-4-deoxychorismate lyase
MPEISTKRLLETICIIDGYPQNIIYHNQRFNQSSRLFWPTKDPIDLFLAIKVPLEFQSGIVRCRVLYRNEIEDIQFFHYQKKSIKNLQLIETNIDYACKYEDRDQINELVKSKGNCDDILMVKNGLITDSSYANIVFKAGNQLFTPKIPMLAGTKRQKLIDEKSIIPIEIGPNDLQKFSHFAIINSFIDLHEDNFHPIQNIKN